MAQNTTAELQSQALRAGDKLPFMAPWSVLNFGYHICENYYSDVSVLTTGASPVTLFNVTGLVEVKLVAASDGALTSTSDTGTLAVGFTGLTTLLLGTTTINTTNFPAAQATVWIDTSPTVIAEAIVASNLVGVLTNANIILTIATNSMLTGALRFCCAWRPWSSNGAVVPAR